MSIPLGSAIRDARKAAGKTQAEVASHLGIERQAVTAWETGKNDPTTENLIRVAELLGKSVAELTGGKVSILQPEARAPVVEFGDAYYPAPTGDLPKNVPVLGLAVGGEDADFYWNGETIDLVKRPVSLANAKGVYALYLAGESMSPKYEEGELVYVNPSRHPQIGDYVIVELHPAEGERSGAGFVKRLVKRTSTTIVTLQFNPEKEIVFQLSEVRALHRIVPWTELMGI